MQVYRLEVLEGETVEATGTGWFVRPDCVVTAFHVVSVEEDGVSRRWRHEVFKDSTIRYQLRWGSGPDEVTPLDHGEADPESDLALLRCPSRPEGAHALRLRRERPGVHTKWVAEGFPRAWSEGSFPLRGSVLSHRESKKLTLALSNNLPAEGHTGWSGASGSPVVIDGQVAGVLLSVADEATGGDTAWAATSDALIALLHCGSASTPQRRRYLKKVCATAQGLSAIFKRDDRRTWLDDVFVKVEVDSAPRRIKDGPWSPDEASLIEHHDTVRQEPFELIRVLEQEGDRWLLLGDPGTGKTMLLHRLVLDLEQRADPRLPVLLRLGDLIEGGEVRSLEASLKTRWGRDTELLLAAIESGQAVVLLDGLDEVPDVALAEAAVVEVDAAIGDVPLIVAGRRTDDRARLYGFVELGICPLGDDEQVALLSKWLRGSVAARRTEAEALAKRLRASDRLGPLARNPLLLTLAGVAARKGHTVPERRSGLYELTIAGLLVRGHDPRLSRAQGRALKRAAPLRREALEVLALALHGEESHLYRLEHMVTVLEGHAGLKAKIGEDTAGFLRDIANETQLLLHGYHPEDLKEAYRFPHRTFREFLAASALTRDVKDCGVGALPDDALTGALDPERAAAEVSSGGTLDAVIDDARRRPGIWTEVLALTCGLLPSSGKADRCGDDLLRRVAAQGGFDLFRRVLADAEGLTPETIAAVLAIKRGPIHWEERRDVLLRMPTLLGDCTRTLKVLMPYLRGTSCGNDLYFGRALLRDIASGALATPPGEWGVEEVRRHAARLAASLLREHKPEARAVVLKRLVFKTVLGGTFWMGSDEGDALGYSDEQPRHEVTLSPFEMTDTPITHSTYEIFDPHHDAARQAFKEHPPSAQDDWPVYKLTWYEAQIFAEWLQGSLPTEAQWERACRGEPIDERQEWCFGNDEAKLEEYGWYHKNSESRPHAVRALKANPLGLYDLHGNVWEWCLDHWRDDDKSPSLDSVDPCHLVDESGQLVDRHSKSVDSRRPRSVRGGSWSDLAGSLRCASRFRVVPEYRDFDLGFRVVRLPLPRA